VPFVSDMASAYAGAAVVVARAGATTVAELCALGRPAVLIPYPFAADDHQAKNAESLEERGAARCIRERDLTVEGLAADLAALLDDRSRRRAMAEAARRLGRPEAAAAIVDDLCEWLGCPPRLDEAEGAAAPVRGQNDGGGGARFAGVARRPLLQNAPRRQSWIPGAVGARRPLVVHPLLVR
jgi:UDP-N-acetylglucosamine--N-acetylmuramyl-(pentapeptide) pyrophosphoryl-undecaprenol N-acetylglucosamine transferase